MQSHKSATISQVNNVKIEKKIVQKLFLLFITFHVILEAKRPTFQIPKYQYWNISAENISARKAVLFILVSSLILIVKENNIQRVTNVSLKNPIKRVLNKSSFLLAILHINYYFWAYQIYNIVLIRKKIFISGNSTIKWN